MKPTNGYGSVIGSGEYRTSAALGVLLMVAIVTVLVAIIGTFSFGLAMDGADAPTVALATEIDLPSDQIILAHRGGDTLEPDRTRFLVLNETDGSQITVSADPSADAFETGDRIAIQTTHRSDSGWRVEEGSETFALRHEATYTIEIVDDKTQTVIYRTSLTLG